MDKTQILNFQMIHNIRLYLPPIITTLQYVSILLISYKTPGETLFVSKIIYYPYGKSSCTNKCFFRYKRLHHLSIIHLMGNHIIDINSSKNISPFHKIKFQRHIGP